MTPGKRRNLWALLAMKAGLLALRALPLVLLLAPAAHAETAVLLGPSAHYRFSQEGYHLPDRRVTPGESDTMDRKVLCETKWGLDARAVSEGMKKEVTTMYGVPHKLGPGGYEIDHLCSRENCGRADVIKNLWPQPWAEARLKDRVENRVHKAICEEQGDILRLQHQLIVDWTVLYQRWFGPLPRVK